MLYINEINIVVYILFCLWINTMFVRSSVLCILLQFVCFHFFNINTHSWVFSDSTTQTHMIMILHINHWHCHWAGIQHRKLRMPAEWQLFTFREWSHSSPHNRKEQELIFLSTFEWLLLWGHKTQRPGYKGCGFRIPHPKVEPITF